MIDIVVYKKELQHVGLADATWRPGRSIPDRSHLGCWGPSPRCYTMGHLVRPPELFFAMNKSWEAGKTAEKHASSFWIKWMGSRLWHFEIMIRYDQIWFELRSYIVFFQKTWWFPPQPNSYVEASTANSHWSLWKNPSRHLHDRGCFGKTGPLLGGVGGNGSTLFWDVVL